MKLIFLSKKHEVNDVFSFVFKPVEPVTWLAGQSIRLEIDGHERRFSIASAPFEQNIAIATRLSGSDFKRALDSLKEGDEIDAYNIEGTFLWNPNAPKKVLLAGGVGITAYIPMFRQLSHDKQPIDALLLYANRDEQFLFGDELTQLQQERSELNVKFLPGQRISSGIIEKYITEPVVSLVYLSGPEAMVNDVAPLLLAAGVKTDNIKRDIFTGRPGWAD